MCKLIHLDCLLFTPLLLHIHTLIYGNANSPSCVKGLAAKTITATLKRERREDVKFLFLFIRSEVGEWMLTIANKLSQLQKLGEIICKTTALFLVMR